MKSFLIALFFLLLGSSMGFGQTSSVNDFKYVLVPEKYDWSKENDAHQVNSLTTFLFKKYGFMAYTLGEALPEDLNSKGCNTLTADVQEDSSFFKTKLKVVLKDCSGNTVFISQEGISKLKEFKPAYHQALRDAFNSIDDLKYVYNGKQKEKPARGPVQDKKVTASKVKEKPAAPVVKEIPVIKQPKITAPQEQTIVKEKPVVVNPQVNPDTATNDMDRYKSLDGSYRMDVQVGKMVFYEGDEVIGILVPKAAAFYDVITNEFSGKGYFSGNQFIIEREIKGVQGIIKMIFEKQ